MADGRKIPYIIEMIADDTTLRNQMKKWNWEDIMGTKGKGFADILGQEGKEAKEQIEDALMKLDLDWAKIFGMDKLEAALSRTFKKSRTKIESAIADVDTNKLKTTIEFIEGLGKAFEEMDAKFEAGSAARSLAPLLRTLEQMPEAAKRVEAAFGSLSEKLDKNNKPIVITPSFDFTKADKDVEDLKRRLNDLDKNVSIKIGLDDNQVSDKVDEIVYHVGEANDKIKKLQEELDAPETTKEREREIRVELAKQLSLRTDYYRTIAKMKKHYGKVVDDVLLSEDDFKGLNLTKEIKKSKDQITNLINKVSSTSSPEQNSAIHVGVLLPTAEDIRSAVNAEIIKLNKRKDALQSVKIQIDPTGTSIDETTSKATVTDRDDNFIQNINQRFDAISKAIKTRQDEIVTQTKDVWRKEILQQLKFRSSDFEFNFGDALIEGLQTALDEADFKVNIDTEFLTNQIKTIFENTHVSLGSGTANINQESMTAAVMAGVRAALFGEQVVATTSSPASAETVEGAEHIAKETENVAKRLDIAEDYVKDVVEKIKAIARYAVKPEDKDSPGARATRDKFSLLGLDLTQIKNEGNNDEKIASILETALLSKDDDGQLLGRTVIDTLAQFKGSSSKTIPAFLTSLHEVFFMLQESTQSVEEWTRINKSRTILDDARKKAQDAVALLDVRKTIKKGEVPTIAEIDELTSTMEPYLEQIAKRSLSYSGKKIEELAQEKRTKNKTLDFDKSIEEARQEIYKQILSQLRSSFADFKTARETLGNKTDEASIAEFQSAANDFYKSSTKLFIDLKNQAEDMFKGEIYLQGGKNGYIKKRDINSYKQLASIKDDDVIVDVRVTSSLNNVAIGEAKSEYDEQRLMRGQRADYLVDKTHEEDILRRQLKYKGFNPQGSEQIPINIEASIEGMQKRIAKADEDIPKLQEQIKLLDKEVEIKRQEAKTARAFLESIKNNPNATESEKRDANTAEMRAYGKLYDVISERGALTKQIDELRASQDRANNLIEQLKLTEQYNGLLTKSLELEGSIIKLEKDGASQKELEKRKKELDEIHTQLTDIKSAADAFGGLYQQSVGKEYSATERKTYALEQLKFIDNDLITARAQKSVIGARMSKKDREIAEVDKYGLGAGIGARELGREKGRVTSEFIRSEYVTSLIDEAREQTKNAIAKAVSKSELAETNMLREFNDRVANAMIQDGLNPHSDEQTKEFLKTKRGKQYSEDYNKSIETIRGELERDTRTMWTLYEERIKTIRTQAMTEFKESLKTENGVLQYMSKAKDDATGEWVSEIVEVDVRKALKERLEEERRILKEQLEGDAKNGKPSIQSEIERLESDRRTAIEYGGVGESEILSADIIKDQIRKEEDLAKLQEKRVTKLQELNDLEKAGISEDDQSVKQTQKELTNLDKEIARYEMLIRDRQKLVELRWDERKADSYTAEEKELHFTEQVVNYNQKIEDSLVRQEDLKEKLNSATEEEKAKLQYQLDQEEAKVEKWRQDISALESKIQKIGDERIGIARTKTSGDKFDSKSTNLIKQIAGNDVDNAKLSEIAEILNNILKTLTNDETMRNPEIEKKLARVRKLEEKSGRTIGYHGTKNGGFAEFDISKARRGHAIFLSDNKNVAATYAGGSDKDIDLTSGQMGQKGVYTVNVTADKVLTVDAHGAAWSQLAKKGTINDESLIQSTNKIGYKLSAKQNSKTSEIYYDKSSFIGIDDDSLPKLSLSGTAEQISKKMLEAGYTQEIVDLILYRSQQDIQSGLDKLKQGKSIETKPRYGAIGFNKELQRLAQETTDDIVEQAFVKGFDRVDFTNIRDIGPGLSNKTKGIPLSTVYAVKEASQAQIVKPTTNSLSKREKTELARLKKEVGVYENQIDHSGKKTTDSIGAFAREDTLSKILEVLNVFKSDGVKVTGKKQGEAKTKEPKIEKTEAELIKERALKDKDAVLGIAANSKVKKKYEQLVKQLESESDLGKIKALAQKTSALGFNIKKESAEWDYKTADANRVYNIPNANLFGKRKDTVRKSMEKLAQTQFNPDGKQYEFLNFDGKQLVYQLTDVRGNVEKVTMEWSELNNQVAITSDKSVSKLDELAGKIEAFGGKFEDAIDAGYLGAKDKDLKKFQDAVVKINDEISNGASFETIDKLRNEALRIADQVDKKASKNKKTYSGTTEINAVTRQHNNMEARNILGNKDIKLIRQYDEAYNSLIKKFNRFKTNGTLFNPKNQKTLQNMAIQVNDLGKKAEKAYNRLAELTQKVEESGTYNGKSIGDLSQVKEGVNVYDAMRAKLEELGATNIKIDKIHQRATGTIRHNNRTVSDLEVSYDELSRALARYQKQERESLTGLPAFLNGFQKKFNSIMQYLSMTMSIHQVLAQLRKGIQYIREIDLALTELKKVTDETEESYDRFLENAAKTGERLGSTISAVTEATATFAKLGYSMEQATEMAEAAIVYKNVGDNIASTEDAADSIISTMKGFGLEASESMAIVDKFNEVGNRFAITSQGIGEALRLSASALNEGKNSLDESIALITAANEVVNDPSSVGTALKTLTLRLRGSKTELEEMGEDVTDMATTTSQLQAKLLALTGGKVDIMLDANTFKNTTQILREMAGAWEDMNDIQRASALELMGGKRQANTLSALIQNFETVEEAIEASSKSAGSALKENERYLNSIQGKIDQFNNAVQAMWSNTLDSDVVKFFVGLGTELVKIVDQFGLIQTLLFSFLTFKSVFGKGSFDLASMLGIHELGKGWTFGEQGATGWFAKKFINKKKETEEIEKTIDDITDAAQNKMQTNIKEMPDGQLTFDFDATDSVQLEVQEYKSLLSVLSQVQNIKLSMGDEQKVALQIDEINTAASQGQVALTQYASTLGDNDMALKAYIASLDGGQASLAGFNQFIQTHNAKVKTSGITAKAAAVGHALLNAAISMGISLIVSAAISAITALINKHQELARAAKEAMSEYSNATNTLREHYNTIEEIKDEYEELADGVDNLGKNVSLTTEEYGRYNKIANQIADMFPQMVAGYTEEGNAILKLKGNVEALKNAYEAEAKAARDALLVEANKIVGSNYNASGASYDHWGGDGFWGGLGKDAGEMFSAGLWQATASSTEMGALKKYLQDGGVIDGSGQIESVEISRILQTLQDAGADVSYWEILTGDKKALDRVISENRTIVEAVLGDIDASLTAAASGNRSVMDAYLKNSDQYDGLDDKTKSVIDNVVQNLDEEFLTSFKSSTDMYTWILDDLLGDIGNLSVDNKTKFDAIFDLQTQFNSGEVSVDEYLTQLSSFQDLLRSLGVNEEIIKSISLLFDVDGLDAKQNVAKDFLLDEFDANVGQLTKTDLDIVNKYATEFEKDMTGVGYTWDDFVAKINEKKLIDAFSPQDFEKVSDGLDSIQSAYNSLSDAVEQYNNTGYLTLDSLQAILSLEPEYLALLQMENGQLSINQAAAEAMIQAKLAEAEANAIQSAMTQLETLAKEAATKATNDNATAATNAITSLGNYSSALGTVAQDAIVAAGAVSALNNAVDGAKEVGVSEEDINAVMSNLDTYLSLINTTRENLSTSFVPIVKGGTGEDPEGDTKDTKIADGWEKLLAKYENQLALITNERDLIEAEIDRMEAQGGKASAEYYEDLIRSSAEEKALLEEKKAALEEYLAANAGAIDQDTWTDYNNEINATAVAIKECEINTIEWAEAMREIDLHYFEQASDEISRLGEELEFVNSLLEDEEVADENGNWSSAALTRMGMYTNQMEMAAANAARYQEQINDLNEEYSNGAISEEQYQEKLSDLVGSQQDAIMSYEDTKDSIVALNEARIDAIREGIEKEIEAYQDLTDAKKEELDAERDLHDFRNNIKKQTKDISELERRIASLSGSSAASDVAERRRLEAQLMEAKEGLNDTYYDHSHNAMSAALDEENEAYALSKEKYIERLEEQLKDTETLISNSIMDVMLNADTVYNELNTLADTYGVTLSDELTQPWKDASTQAIKWKDELKLSMTSGEYASLIGEGGAVTAFANGVATKLQGSWTKAQTAAKNYAGYLTGTELKNRFTSTLTGFGNQIQNIIDKWNGVKRAADDAYAAQTRKVTVGGSGTGGGNGQDSSNNNGGKYETPTPSGPDVTNLQKILNKFFGLREGDITGLYDNATFMAVRGMQKKLGITASGEFDASTKRALEKYLNSQPVGSWFRSTGVYVPGAMYAKGTTGTTRDEWAITDEPQFGDELVLVPGKDGNLSFMRKGTGVVPADMTQKLFELAQIPTSDLMNKNLTAIVPNITKNDFKNEFNFESLVHVDKVDSDTLPKLEKMVDKKIDDFSRALNYSLKKFSR